MHLRSISVGSIECDHGTKWSGEELTHEYSCWLQVRASVHSIATFYYTSLEKYNDYIVLFSTNQNEVGDGLDLGERKGA